MNLARRTQAQTGETAAAMKQYTQFLTSQTDQIASISATVARLEDRHKTDATEANQLRSLATNVMEANIKIFTTTALQMQQLLSNIPAQVDLQQPVFFEDAHGIPARLCLEWFNSLAAFQAGLEAHFQDMPGLKKVKNLEYALEDVGSKRKIDLTKSWRSIFRPGRRVNMSMVFPQTQAQSSSCPGCFSENVIAGGDTNDEIQWSVPRCYPSRVLEVAANILAESCK